MSIVLKNGKVVTPDKTFEADIRIENGIIKKIGKISAQGDDEIIDAAGRFILPGAIDTHTHFDLDTGTTVTADDFESGTKAAITGGTTTILDFATQNKGETLMEALDNWHAKADNKAYCDYGFHMAITDWNNKTSQDMLTMVNNGVTSFKMYMAYKGTLQVDDTEIYEALLRSRELGTIIGFHCENGDIIASLVEAAKAEKHKGPFYHFKTRPESLEREAIVRLATIAEVTKAPVYVVHLSTESGLIEARRARSLGVNLLLETCPQYLLLDNSLYGEEQDTGFEAAKYVMSPPLRSCKDNFALWEGIKLNEIDFIGTDHCSFNFKGQKDIGKDDFSKIPNGAPGVEHRLYLMYTYGVCEGKISINKMTELLSTNAAKAFGLYPKKGIIKEGSDADLVIFNPDSETKITYKNQVQKVDYTPYEGFYIKGAVESVFLRGTQVVNDGKLVVNSPTGEFQKRKTTN